MRNEVAKIGLDRAKEVAAPQKRNGEGVFCQTLAK
jgi:hypothetical protein